MYKKRMRQLGVLSPVKAEGRGGGITSLPFTARLEKIQASFLDVCSKGVKGNGHKL